ncbi:type II secretion system protein N [Variovorax sp. J22P168]|uniref:type II secretion system protein N n=1 Tax=Variovorax jilinensis TaxID=3053513 RepID=UPI0025777DCA|nr:type II secretion system protein N [Variovorax sp. J22P168]MDM0011339.1 type II secretion system protein N [Variovorax sp. J22P168]
MAVPYAPPRWPSATATTLLWALAAASIVFWGLRLAAPADAPAPPVVSGSAQAAPDPAALARMLGAVPAQSVAVAAPDAASRFVLLGVVADLDRQGAALIAVDGKPPRPFRVGAAVADGYVLQALDARAATFGTSAGSAPAFTLQLPTRPLASNPPRAEMPGSLPAVMAPPPIGPR